MTGAVESPSWPLLHYVLDDFTEPWRDPPAEVVLLHPGLGGNGRLYGAWVPVLGDVFRVLHVDARGQGLSPRPDGYAFTLAQWLDDVVTVLDHLEIARVHWVGASGGGIIGQYAAVTAPERIASLSLVATTAHFRGPAGNYDDWLEPLDRGDVAQFILRDGERRFGADNPARTRWVVGELVRTPATTVAELHRWVRSIDLRERLPEITCPTLVVTGEFDTLTDLDDARLLADRIPNTRLEILRGRPHNVGYTHPHQVASIVKSFLVDVADSGRYQSDGDWRQSGG